MTMSPQCALMVITVDSFFFLFILHIYGYTLISISSFCQNYTIPRIPLAMEATMVIQVMETRPHMRR